MDTSRAFLICVTASMLWACGGDRDRGAADAGEGRGSDAASAQDAGGSADSGQDGAASSPPDAGILSPAEYCERVVAAQCRAHQLCCEHEIARYASEPDCVSARIRHCERVLMGSGWEDDWLRLDSDAALALVREIEAASETCSPHMREPLSEPIVGRAPLGTDCAEDSSSGDLSPALICAAGLECKAALVDGRVQAECREEARAGQSCSDRSCGAGLYCSAEKSCEPRGGPDATCRRLGDCAAGHFCRSGTCSTPTLCLRVPS